MSIRTICVCCDKYYTQMGTETLPGVCPDCLKELGVVKSALAERTIKQLHLNFPADSNHTEWLKNKKS